MTRTELQYMNDRLQWEAVIQHLNRVKLVQTSTVENNELQATFSSQMAKFINWIEAEANKIQPL